MNLEALRTRFLARGFEYLDAETANDFLNDAYLLDICEEESWGGEWSFLEEVVEDEAPVTIADLRTIEYVIDVTQQTKLDPMKRARITDDWNVDLTQTGNPSLYYVTQGTTVNVFPVASDTIQVRYWKVAPRLEGSGTPLLPTRYHSLIVDGAVARAYEESDDFELAQASRERFEQRLARMANVLGMPQHDSNDDYVVIEDPYAL